MSTAYNLQSSIFGLSRKEIVSERYLKSKPLNQE